MNSIKRLVDGKIKKSIIDGYSIDHAISILKSNSEKFGKCIIDQNINKQSKRYEYIQIYILWTNNRIDDLKQIMENLNYEVYQISQENGDIDFIHIGDYTDNLENIKKLLMMSIEQGIDNMIQQMQGKEVGKGQIIMPYIYFDIDEQTEEITDEQKSE